MISETAIAIPPVAGVVAAAAGGGGILESIMSGGVIAAVLLFVQAQLSQRANRRTTAANARKAEAEAALTQAQTSSLTRDEHVKELREFLSDMRGELDRAQELVEKLRSELDGAYHQLDEKAQEVASLRVELVECRSSLASLTSRLDPTGEPS